MYLTQQISIGNLLLDINNYRIVKQSNQKGARDAIIAEQGKKLVKLAEDIITNGLNPADLPIVIDSKDGSQNYIIVEGNRRLTAIYLMFDPELAKNTFSYNAFMRLNKNHADKIPKLINCVIAPNKQSALIWINRKHANGLKGAGTEHWTSLAKARADVDRGIPRPDLDIINFVLSDPSIDEELRTVLEGPRFNITTLERLITTKELQDAIGFSLQNGKLSIKHNKSWITPILTDLVKTIANGERKGKSFTERDIDSQQKRAEFVTTLINDHPGKKKSKEPWILTTKLNPTANTTKPSKLTRVKNTQSTENQPNLIPKNFSLKLPAGKINDIFFELKKLDVESYRHAVSVLFRVFLELTLEEYIEKHSIKIVDNRNNPIDKMSVRLNRVVEHVKTSSLLTVKELKPIEKAMSDKHSLLAPDTLNAYVHSRWLNPTALDLKITWTNIQLFIERLWRQNSKAGQN